MSLQVKFRRIKLPDLAIRRQTLVSRRKRRERAMILAIKRTELAVIPTHPTQPLPPSKHFISAHVSYFMIVPDR